MGAFIAEALPLILALARAGQSTVEALEWTNAKVQTWQQNGTEPTDADFAELRERRHANDAIIARG